MRYPPETRIPQIVFFMTLDRTARLVLDASHALPDYPLHAGRVQAGHLHLCTDAAMCHDAFSLLVPVMPVAPELDIVVGAGFEPDQPASEQRAIERARSSIAPVLSGAASHYESMYQRTRADVRTLVGESQDMGDSVRDLRLHIAVCVDEPGGAGLLLPVLLLGQRLKAELQDFGVQVDRYVLLALPPRADDRQPDVHRRAVATLLSLEVAARYGIDLAGDQLRAPIAESVVVVGHGRVWPNARTQIEEGAAILRLLADPGAVGTEVRARLRRRQDDPRGEAGLFRSIGLATLVLEPEPAVGLVTDLLLLMDANAD